jgi:hypothetical protein
LKKEKGKGGRMGLLDPPPSTGGGNTHAVGGGSLLGKRRMGTGCPVFRQVKDYPFWVEHDVSILLEIQRPESLQS